VSKRRRRVFYTVLIAAGLAGLLVVLLVPLAWFSPAFSARVVNVSSEQPVEGARVTVSWDLGGPFSSAPIKRLASVSAVTDADGRFHVPGWGPRFYFGWATVSRSEPVVMVAHPDYETWKRNNNQVAYRTGGVWGLLIRLAVRNQSIELEPLSKEARE
jgi:hypothetical protein